MKIHVRIDNSEEIEKLVMENHIDFALMEGEIHNPQIISEKFVKDELIRICGKSHSLAATDAINAEQLKNYDFLLRERGQRHPGTV
jgi:DNA-binding transcriptional LysR family regulator